jgi:hypothetical protein
MAIQANTVHTCYDDLFNSYEYALTIQANIVHTFWIATMSMLWQFRQMLYIGVTTERNWSMKNEHIRKAYKTTPKIMKNRSSRLQNHEQWGLGGDLEAIGAQGGSRDQNVRWDWLRMAPFGLHFGRHFRSKQFSFCIVFYIKFRKAFLEDLSGFRTSISWLLGSKFGAETENAKIWKTYVLLKKTYVFEGPGVSF